MARSVNGPTPSEFSFGRGSRPSLELYPQPDLDFDPLATKRAVMQTDPTDPNAPIDYAGDYVGYDQYGRPLPTLADRGYTPIVRENGRGEADDRLDPTNPYLYEQREGKGADPNESWYDVNERDPIRVGWEVGNYPEEANRQTDAYKYGTGEMAQKMSAVTNMRDTKVRKIKRTPPLTQPWYRDGEADPRRDYRP